MSDLEKLKVLFDELGIGYDEIEGIEQYAIVLEGGTKNVGGGIGLTTWFIFDIGGKFAEVGIYE